MRSVEFFVEGLPVSQGSKRCFCLNGHAVMKDDAKGLGPWRTKVAQAARQQSVSWVKHVPLQVEMVFTFPVTKGHRGGWKATAPDIEKLVRAVHDGLKIETKGRFVGRGVLPDDAQVVRLVAEKVYGDNVGVLIRVVDAPSAYDQLPIIA